MFSTSSQSSSSQNGNSIFHSNRFGGSNKNSTNLLNRPNTSSGTTDYPTLSNSKAPFTRKASFTNSTPKSGVPSNSRGRNPPQPNNNIPNFTLSPPRRNETVPPTLRSKPSLTLITPKDYNQARPRSANRPEDDYKEYVSSTASARPRIESWSSTAPYSNMIVAPYTRENPPRTTFSNGGYPQPAWGGSQGPQSPTLESITYQHIQEMASKRISTLDYLRKAHEGRVYWFNTLLFNKPDLTRLPSLDSRKLARRSTNYLLLGLSLPPVLDLSSNTALEFLRTLNALLAEFEAFQNIHPSDGSGSSSLSRARLPQMFKRAASSSAMGKGRRTSSATEIGLPAGNDGGLMSGGGFNGSIAESTSSSATSFPVPMTTEQDLLPGEEYVHLLTPSLPFDPDFYETFATLCDVLIDCYQRLLNLVSGSAGGSGSNGSLGGTIGQGEWALVGEMFTQADKRVRRIIVQGVVKEFEDGSRAGVRSEVAGVGKVVLGGLM